MTLMSIQVRTLKIQEMIPFNLSSEKGIRYNDDWNIAVGVDRGDGNDCNSEHVS